VITKLVLTLLYIDHPSYGAEGHIYTMQYILLPSMCIHRQQWPETKNFTITSSPAMTFRVSSFLLWILKPQCWIDKGPIGYKTTRGQNIIHAGKDNIQFCNLQLSQY